MSEIDTLRVALQQARDTFVALENALYILDRPLLAEACRVAVNGCNRALRDQK